MLSLGGMGENPRLSAKAMKFTQCRPALLLAGQDKNPQEKKRPEWPMKVPTDFRGIEEAKNKNPTVGSSEHQETEEERAAYLAAALDDGARDR